MSRYSDAQEHIKAYYGISVQRGTRVEFEGRPGRVTGFRGQYLLVRLDDDQHARPLMYHPTWHMTYPDADVRNTQ